LLTIRPAEERDKQAILHISSEVGVFTDEEVATVDELLQAYLYDPEQRDYHFFVACDPPDHILGFVCFGPTALTEGTYDLYWIAVSKSAHRGGVGRTLLDWTEQHLRATGGRLLVAETSGTPEYAPTRHFYERLGYEGHLSVPDFYGPGDDLIVYSKHLR
jgi:ribosomal protein S18 acetylase RimI-like enzyme